MSSEIEQALRCARHRGWLEGHLKGCEDMMKQIKAAEADRNKVRAEAAILWDVLQWLSQGEYSAVVAGAEPRFGIDIQQRRIKQTDPRDY